MSTSQRRLVMAAFYRVLLQEAHVLARRPDLLWQQVYNRLQWSAGANPLLATLLTAEFDRRESAGAGSWLHLLNRLPEDDAVLRTFTGHRNYINDCSISPDAKTLVSAGHGGEVRLWDADSGREIMRLPGKIYHSYACAFSPDGRLVAAETSTQARRIIQIWDTQTGAPLVSLQNPTERIHTIRFQPPGGDLLFAAGGGLLRVWNVASGEILREMPDQPWTLDLNGDLQYLALLEPEPVLHNLRAETQVVLSGFAGTFPAARQNPWQPPYYAFSPDASLLAMRNENDDLFVWNARTGELLGRRDTSAHIVHAAAQTAKGPVVFFSRETVGSFDFWEIGHGPPVRVHGHTKGITGCAVSRDGSRLATASWDWSVKLWDTTLLSEGVSQQDLPQGIEDWGWSGEVKETAFEPEGHPPIEVRKNLIPGGGLFGKASVASFDIHDRGSGRTVTTTGGHPTSPVQSCAFSPDGRWMASVGWDRWLRVWDVVTGRESAAFPALGGLDAVHFSETGEEIRIIDQASHVYYLRLTGTRAYGPVLRS